MTNSQKAPAGIGRNESNPTPSAQTYTLLSAIVSMSGISRLAAVMVYLFLDQQSSYYTGLAATPSIIKLLGGLQHWNHQPQQHLIPPSASKVSEKCVPSGPQQSSNDSGTPTAWDLMTHWNIEKQAFQGLAYPPLHRSLQCSTSAAQIPMGVYGPHIPCPWTVLIVWNLILVSARLINLAPCNLSI